MTEETQSEICRIESIIQLSAKRYLPTQNMVIQESIWTPQELEELKTKLLKLLK